MMKRLQPTGFTVLLIFVLSVFVVFVSLASQSSKVDRIVELMKLSGIYDAIKAERVMEDRHTEAVRELNKKDLHKKIHILPKQYWIVEQRAYEELAADLEPYSYTTDKYVAMWAEFYGEEFTDSEVETIINYYTSSIGQKDLAAQIKATMKWREFREKGYDNALARATKKYNDKLSDFVNSLIQDRKK